MADWLSSMQHTYEYYTVDPGTWKDVKLVRTVKACTINRDATAETRGSATIDMTEVVGECYIRVYLVTIQNGLRERHPLGTFLIQTQPSSFDGKVQSISVDAYTPLLELKENPPPVGYSLLKGDNIMSKAYLIARDNARAPVIPVDNDKTLYDDFVAYTDDTWLSFESDLVAKANYSLDLDEMGRILFAPKQDMASLQPVWTYDDGDKSIIYSDITVDRDLYGIPNVIKITYSNGFYDETDGTTKYHLQIVNDDPNSPVSIVNRGRKITHRVSDPNIAGVSNSAIMTRSIVYNYAEQLLRELSTLECTASYSHGYCPVRLGDCVRLNYTKAGLVGVKAKVIYQSIKCESGCPVNEKAVFINKLWR